MVAVAPYRQQVTSSYSDGYFSGAALTDIVPWTWDVALNGQPFIIDKKYIQEFRHRSTTLLKPQQDSSTEPGSGSVNPEALWSRSKTTWHLGAGQRRLDATLGTFQSLYHQGNPFRFYASKGVDIWTEGQASLLKATHQAKSSSNTNLRLMPAGSRLYAVDGTALVYTTDGTPSPATWSTTSGTSGSAILSIASDGYNVWVTDGANVLVTNTGATSASSFSTEDIDVLGFVNGRLMGAEDGELFYNVSGTMTSLFVHSAGAQFNWVGFTEGQSCIYAAGYVGDKSTIYRISLRPDATGLDQPIVAGVLPDGEIIRGIGSYLGIVFLGTDLGWRIAIPDTQGNLTIGGLVTTPAAVRCFEGQSNYVWYGWTNYDGTSTGLGRADYSAFGDIDKRQLAYASDLMVTTQGAVLDVVTFGAKRYFAVSGAGLYGEDTLLVASGTLTDGLLDFGLADEKVALQMAVTFGPAFAGTYSAALAVDEGSTFTTAGTTSVAATTSDTYPIGERRATKFEVQHTLTRDGSATTTGPTLTGVTTRVQPAPTMNPRIIVPLLVFDVEEIDGADRYQTPVDIVNVLKELNSTREVFVYQEGPDSYSVEMDDYEWRPEKKAAVPSHGYRGCFVAVLKVL